MQGIHEKAAEDVAEDILTARQELEGKKAQGREEGGSPAIQADPEEDADYANEVKKLFHRYIPYSG